jgi:hypothetical protein
MLPQSLQKPLQHHLAKVHLLHEEDLQEGYGDVYLPYAFVKLSSEPPSTTTRLKQPEAAIDADDRFEAYAFDGIDRPHSCALDDT